VRVGRQRECATAGIHMRCGFFSSVPPAARRRVHLLRVRQLVPLQAVRPRRHLRRRRRSSSSLDPIS
jgi:hypothetical protein